MFDYRKNRKGNQYFPLLILLFSLLCNIAAANTEVTLTNTQKQRVQRAITAIQRLNKTIAYEDSNGTARSKTSAEIARVLQNQLDNGRIKVDTGMAATSYAECLSDGRPATTADELLLHPSVVNGTDSTFLQELLVHEYLHKTQGPRSSEAADEREAYSLEKAYKDTIGVLSTNHHYNECSTSLATYRNQMNNTPPANRDKSRKRSGTVIFGNWFYQIVLGDLFSGDIGWLRISQLGTPGWIDLPLQTIPFPSDIFGIADYEGDIDLLIICGSNGFEGVISQLMVTENEVIWEAVSFIMPEANFYCFAPPPELPNYERKWLVLDDLMHRILIIDDTNFDMVPDSFFDIFISVRDFPPLENTLRIEWDQSRMQGIGLKTCDRDKSYTNRILPSDKFFFMIDNDLNFHPEIINLTPAHEFINYTPTFQSPLPWPHQPFATLFGNSGSILQVSTMDDTGGFTQLLGEFFMEVPEMNVDLPVLLMPGQKLLITDITNNQTMPLPYTVPGSVEVEISFTDGIPVLKWQPYPDAEYYQVYFANDFNGEYLPVTGEISFNPQTGMYQWIFVPVDGKGFFRVIAGRNNF